MKNILEPRQKKYSSKELLEIFPESEPYIIERLNKFENIYLPLMEKKVKQQLEWAKTQKTPWFEEMVIETNDGLLLDKIEKEIKRLKMFFIENSDIQGHITEEEIQTAKSIKMKELLGTDKNFIHCPNHQEKTPSFYLKGNFGYCFGCGYSCDTIQWLIDQEGLSFSQAVKKLLTLC
jgi:hypothetical protein